MACFGGSCQRCLWQRIGSAGQLQPQLLRWQCFLWQRTVAAAAAQRYRQQRMWQCGGSRSRSLSAGTGRALALSVDHEQIHNNQMVLLVNGSGTSYAEQKWVWSLVNVDDFGGWRRNCNDRRVTEQKN
jgi:hypothetical protein